MPDLIDIPGLAELWRSTKGDRRITVAVLDGSVDLERACFEGANLSRINPYWAESIEIDPKYLEIFLEIENSGDSDTTKTKKLLEAIPDQYIRNNLDLTFHATHVSSIIFGQPNSPVQGIAPYCTGINIPIAFDSDNFINPLNLSRAINQALDLGANIIHVAACHPTQTGVAQELLTKAVQQAQQNNVLIVAPGGNNQGECWCIPAVLPHVLAVGAMKDSGEPFKFSNWGGQYQEQGILVPGENILGAQPGTDKPIRKKGTSCAAPVMTGIAALLMSLQLKEGITPDAEAIRAAVLNSAIVCDSDEMEEPERCLRGKLNLPGAYQLLTGKTATVLATSDTSSPTINHQVTENQPNTQVNSLKSEPSVTIAEAVHPSELESTGLGWVNAAATTNSVIPSLKSDLVYALGTLGYDFGTEARRDTFKQFMSGVEMDGVIFPANPYDARQIVDYLEENLFEAKSLIWTLNIELTPIYAIEPSGAFAVEVYETLLQMLSGQVLAEASEEYIQRISLPGKLSDRTVRLFSGQIIPVIEIDSPRGMYGWKTNTLVEATLATVDAEGGVNELAMRKSLTNFLVRVYYDLRNLGQIAKDRALNFAATNAFQAASVFSLAIAQGMELDNIEVEKSPFGRLDSDCWDVKLKFFDPENGRRARRVFRFTIDVADRVPVTLGEVRSWSVPN